MADFMELLERDRCVAEFSEWRVAASKTGGCVVLVRGEAGIGKTTLLHELCSRQREMRVLWGGCDDLFTPRPLAPLHDIARQCPGELLETLNSGASRDRIFTAALNELERTATLVVFEDMHWADEATLDLLQFLGRRLPRANVRRILLAPLSESAVAQLARGAHKSPEGLYGITGGNPLFLTEVLAS